MSDLPNLTAKLEHMLINLLGATSPNSLSDVHAAIEAIIGPPGVDGRSLPELLTGVRDSIQALRGDENTTLSSLLRTDEYVSAQIQLNSKLVTIQEQLDHIAAAVGAVPYNSLELGSVRGILWSLYQCCQAGRLGTAPAGGGDVSSSGEIIADGRRYARFVPPIEGVTVAPNGYDITSTWSGWEAYIQTADPAPKIGTAVDVPNAWLPLVGSGTINFSVAGQYTISVFLKRPVVGDEFCSVEVTRNWNGTTFQGIAWPAGYDAVNTANGSNTFSQAIYWPQNAFGSVWRVTSGTDVYMERILGGVSYDGIPIGATDTEITYNTDFINIYSTAGAFCVELVSMPS